MTTLIAWISSILAVALGVALLLFAATSGEFQVQYVAPFILGTLGYATVSLAVALRRPANRLHWVTRLIALALPAVGLGLLVRDAWVRDPVAYPLGQIFGWVGSWLWFLPVGLQLMLVPLLFPTGSPPSPRWRLLGWYVIGIVLVLMVVWALRPGPLGGGQPQWGNNPFGAEGRLGDLLIALSGPLLIAFLPAVLGCVASVVVRFRRARGIERQQLKWFVSAAAFGVLGPVLSLANGLMQMIVPGLADVAVAIGNLSGVIFAFSFVLLPLSIGVAVLRYRLYDIDLLINRTLVYGVLTAALAATYFGAVALLQAALRPLTGQSELAVAGSTLLVVALFAPLRRRIQATVDRRFYRTRYDAAHALDAFGARLRDEVDLDSVRADLLDVVGTTLRPAHASLWLRK